MSECERLPRPGEMVDVKLFPDDDWEVRKVMKVDQDTFEIWSSARWSFPIWRFKDERDKIYELARKIEENDEKVLSELAEIILAARESHKK